MFKPEELKAGAMTENALHFPAIHCILTGHFMNYTPLVPSWTAFKLNSLQQRVSITGSGPH